MGLLETQAHAVALKYHWTIDYWDSLPVPVRNSHFNMIRKDAEDQAKAFEDAKR